MLDLTAINESLPVVKDIFSNDFKNFILLLDDLKHRKDLLKIIENKWWLDQFPEVLKSWLRTQLKQLDFSLVKKISSLLELSYLTRSVVEDCFIDVCNYMVHTFKVICEKDVLEINNTATFNEMSLQTVKLFLQLVQFFPKSVHQALKNTSACNTILQYVVVLLTDKRFSKDCSLLCGTVFALLFDVVDQSKSVLETLKDFLDYTGTIGEYKKKTIYIENTWIVLSNVSSPYAQMSLIVGLLKTKSKAINTLCDNGFPFIHVLFEVIRLYCENASDSSIKYLAFKAMHLWLLHVQTCKLIPLYCNGTLFMYKSSLYLESLLSLVWCHAEDLVENVPYFVQQIFSLTLQLYKEECDLRVIDVNINFTTKNEFYNRLASILINQAWYMKGRWSLLSELVSYLGFTKLLSLHKRFNEEMLECMGTSNLPVASNNFYTAILKNMRISSKTAKDVVIEWCTYFEAFLSSAMQNEQLCVRQNVGQYLVPTTFQLLPETFSVLENNFKCLSSPLCCHAYVISLKHARINKIITTQDLELRSDILNSCLNNIDLNIRSDAFEVLCNNPKLTEPLTSTIQSMVLQYVLYNLNSDSSSFRQKFVSSLKKLLKNVRESCVILCKKKKDHSELEHLIEFVEEVIRIVRTCLTPLSSYQRKRTGLHLLELLTDIFVYVSEEAKKHKGAPSVNSSVLFEFVTRKKRWNILSTFDHDLLCCIEDQHDEIREEALKLLIYHQSLVTSEYLIDFNSLKKTLNIAFSLIKSLKFHEAESGAMLIQFIANRLVSNSQISSNILSIVEESNIIQQPIIKDGTTNHQVTTKEGIITQHQLIDHSKVSKGLHAFALYILSYAKKSWAQAQKDYFYAAASDSVYGSVLAFAYIIKLFFNNNLEIQHHLFDESVKLYSSMASSLLQLLMNSDSFDGSEISPSFADMNNAIDSCLKKSPSYSIVSEKVGHVHCKELLISFCWLNMKSISVAFAAFAELLSVKNYQFLNITNFTLMMEFYKQSLIKCRHKGIVESCYASFCTYAKSVSNIPVFWQDLMRHCIETIGFCTSFSHTSSVTMRSVGIPMFVQAILSAEPSGNHGSFLCDIVSRLVQTASTPLENVDRSLPQFNAISILKAIFRDTSLRGAVLPYVERGIILTIEGFLSPSWSIRNASTQLLGALIQRMLGQRISQTEDNSQNAGTVDIFFNRYQSLCEYFVSSLSGVSKRMFSHPRLPCTLHHVIPVLTILSKLHPASVIQNKRSHEILLNLLSFKSSPVWKIRDLTTKAILAFTPMSRYAIFCEEVYSELVVSTCKNTIHSLLMILLKMSSINDCCPSVYVAIFGVLNRLYEKNLCCISQSVYIDTLIQCCKYLKSKDVLMFTFFYVKKAMTSLCKDLIVGQPYLEKSLAKVAVYFAKNENKFIENKSENENDLVYEVTISPNSGLHLQFLKNITSCINVISNNSQLLVAKFALKCIAHSQSQLFLQTTFTCLSFLPKKSWTYWTGHNEDEYFTSHFLKLIMQYPGLKSVILPNLYKVMSQRLQNKWKSFSDLKTMCEFIKSFSMAEQIEDLRLAAANSIGFLEDFVLLLPSAKNENTSNLMRLLPLLLSSCVCLLQDEDEDIRKIATLNVQFVQKLNKNYVHPNMVLVCLFSYVEHLATENEFACEWLCETLCKSFEKDIDSSELLLFEQEAANLYIEESVVIDLAAFSLKNVLCFSQDIYRTKLNIYTNQLYEKLLFKQSVQSSKSLFGLFGVRKNLLELYTFIRCVHVSDANKVKHIQFLKDLSNKVLLPSVFYNYIYELSSFDFTQSTATSTVQEKL
ncbi:tRNA (32-2'-O)-methyltransferase regulator THADA isoform X3 [Hydra vulgaris]|uniref:tRNA (32-2'-O)-methyltransferase regulator THADA isoform X3 n=1 Tax=Hydra vulgaris TaxID=6087 RepID=A0ABM4CFV6_HYDVU